MEAVAGGDGDDCSYMEDEISGGCKHLGRRGFLGHTQSYPLRPDQIVLENHDFSIVHHVPNLICQAEIVGNKRSQVTAHQVSKSQVRAQLGHWLRLQALGLRPVWQGTNDIVIVTTINLHLQIKNTTPKLIHETISHKSSSEFHWEEISPPHILHEGEQSAHNENST
ncbi:disease resistance protein [Striga asiatica]|uniref:Disease resistance protein n=1 Tax=Striga asiatica TaxID=4170 RepID=A0A5A7PV74_STRAF|nr:disease resistance protein [Striga asiatica]